METSEINVIDNLTIYDISAEILIYIFTFLDEKSLSKCTFVCREWMDCSEEGQIWREMIKAPKRSSFYGDEMNPLDGQWKKLYFSLKKLDTKLKFNVIAEGVSASSTDHPQQTIANTIDDDEYSFWSSTGSADQSSNEWLVYKLVQPVCILGSVSILPYKAIFQQGLPIYGPRAIQISIGFSPDNMHWSSPIFPVVNSHDVQKFNISPLLVIGGYVKLELFGRCQTQPQDDLWYTVLEAVEINGIPVGAISNSSISGSLLNYALEHRGFKETVTESLKTFAPAQKPEVSQDRKQICELLSLFFTKDILPILTLQESEQQHIINLYETIKNKDYDKAVEMAASSVILRTNETLEVFKQCGEMALRKYLSALLKQDEILSKNESIDLINIILKEAKATNTPPSKSDLHLIAVWIHRDKLTLSLELGDIFYDVKCLLLATRVYLECSVPDKFIKCFKELKDWPKVIAYSTLYGYRADFAKMLEETYAANPLEGIKFAVALTNAKGGPPIPLETICEAIGIDIGDQWDLRKLILAKLQAAQQSNEGQENSQGELSENSQTGNEISDDDLD